MDKANIIISIIIVLCVAAAVAAYGITNSDNPIFSDLSSMAANGNDAGNGIGNASGPNNGSGMSVDDSGNSGSGSGSDSGSSSGSGSNSGNGGGSSSGSGSGTHLTFSQAQSIANSAVEEPGCYASYVNFSGGCWHFRIYNEYGNVVGGISVDDATGHTDEW